MQVDLGCQTKVFSDMTSWLEERKRFIKFCFTKCCTIVGVIARCVSTNALEGVCACVCMCMLVLM